MGELTLNVPAMMDSFYKMMDNHANLNLYILVMRVIWVDAVRCVRNMEVRLDVHVRTVTFWRLMENHVVKPMQLRSVVFLLRGINKAWERTGTHRDVCIWMKVRWHPGKNVPASVVNN